MRAEINTGVVKGLKYKAGVKEGDPAAIGQLVIEFDADEADAAEVAALIGREHAAREDAIDGGPRCFEFAGVDVRDEVVEQ